MLELGSELRRKRETLSRRAKQHRKFGIFLGLSVFGGYFLFAFLIWGWSAQVDVIKDIPSSVDIVPLLLGLLIGAIFARLQKREELSIEDLLFLNVCSALDDLGVYIEDERETDRKTTERKVDNISKEIEAWDIGSLKLSKEVIGSHFEPFREAFYRKIVGAVRQRKKDDLVTAYRILRQFAKYLVKSEPKIEDLDFMTKAMSGGISVAIPSRITTQKKIFRLIKEATLSRDIIAGSGSLITGYAIGCIGYYTIQVPIEYAYTMSVTVALFVFGAYLKYLRK